MALAVVAVLVPLALTPVSAQESGATPTPDPSASSAATSTPTPAPTATPTPTPEATPTATPAATPAPSPTDTPAPTSAPSAASSPTVSTDKADYSPEQTVTVTGTGFAPNTSYDIPVIRPDGTIVHGDGSFTPGWDTVTTDGSGSFTYLYKLDGVKGTYEIRVYDSPWSGDRSEAPVAQTTFTDTTNSLDQCANSSSGGTVCTDWISGNMGASKSEYFEGDSLPYRLTMPSLSAGTHTATIQWDTLKSGTHALDYITSFNRTVTGADPCLNFLSPCPSSPSTFPIPTDPNVTKGEDGTLGTGDDITQIAGSFSLYGGTISSVGSDSPNFDNALYTVNTTSGDHPTSITIKFTIASANTDAVLAWGGHIASRRDWGANNSASTISGSPFHTRLIDVDGGGGNQDRSLSAGAVIFPASITIIKDAVPDSSQSFGFSSTGGLSPSTFSLVDNGTGTGSTQAFLNITNFTTYTVTESAVTNWALSFGSTPCTVTSSNGGTQTTSGSTLTINLNEGENVTCTFTNTALSPSLTITKSADASIVNAGDTIGFTITVSNGGPGIAQGVTVTDTLPTNAGLSWSISPAVTGCSISSGVLTCGFGDIGPNASKSVHITSSTTPATCGTVTNTASVTTTNDGSGSSTASITVNCPDVKVVKTADQASISAGDTAAFTIVVSNIGAGTARSVTLSDPLPAGVTWSISPSVTGCSITAGTLSCAFGDLAPAATVTIHISGVTDAADCGVLTNTATVAATNEASGAQANDTSTASITVNCATIQIAKTPQSGTVNAGDPIGFDIVVTNAGAGIARNVAVSDTLPTTPGTSWSIGAGSDAGCSIAAGVLSCSFGDLGPGASKTVHITSPTTPATCGTVTNTASVTTTNDGSGSDTASIHVTCGQLEVVKRLQPSTDGGRFDLQIDGTTMKADAGDNDSTRKVVLPVGDHTVGETQGTNTTLSDYVSSIDCRDATGSSVASASGSGPLTVSLTDGSDITCTITNTKLALVTVDKTEDGQVPTDSFTFHLTGGPDSVDITKTANNTNGGNLEFGLLKPGSYTLCEAVPAGFSTTDLPSPDNSGNACVTFTLSAGQEKTFTINDVACATGSVDITATIPNVLTGTETQTFNYSVTGPNNFSANATVTFAAGDTSKSTNVAVSGRGSYVVHENDPSGKFVPVPDGQVDIQPPLCSGTAAFANAFAPAIARVQKVTVPSGNEAGWTFTLKGPGGGETVTTTGTGFVTFSTALQEGTYTITETTTRPGFSQTAATGCTFTVNYPRDANGVFSCTVTNTNTVNPHPLTFFKIHSCRNPGTSDLVTPNLPIKLGSFKVTTCAKAVEILLNPSTKFAEHFLAAYLLAAKLNIALGATQCPAEMNAVNAADNLLSQINWNGSRTSKIVGRRNKLRKQFVSVGTTLAKYVNGTLC